MATQERTALLTEPGQDALRRGRGRPVLWWAAVGVAVIAVQAYVYIAWIASSDFRPVPTGPDLVPHTEKVFAWVLQPLFVLMAIGALVGVVRGCRRSRSLTLDAKLLIAGYLQLWLDPVGGLIQPQFFFNSYYVNEGSWVAHIPGWISPTGGRQADLLLVELPLYGCFIGVAAAGCALMRWIRRRRPQTSNVTLILSVWAAVAVFIMIFEEILILRPGVATWEEIFPGLTLFGGSRFEMSLFPDPVFWGAFIVVIIALRFFATESGRTPVEGGIDAVPRSNRARTAISTLAVIGAVSAAMIVASGLAVTASLYSRTPRDLPSYFRHGMCGAGTKYACPNPGIPIPR